MAPRRQVLHLTGPVMATQHMTPCVYKTKLACIRAKRWHREVTPTVIETQVSDLDAAPPKEPLSDAPTAKQATTPNTGPSRATAELKRACVHMCHHAAVSNCIRPTPSRLAVSTNLSSVLPRRHTHAHISTHTPRLSCQASAPSRLTITHTHTPDRRARLGPG